MLYSLGYNDISLFFFSWMTSYLSNNIFIKKENHLFISFLGFMKKLKWYQLSNSFALDQNYNLCSKGHILNSIIYQEQGNHGGPHGSETW